MVGGQQWIESSAEQGRELVTGEGARDVDLPQELLRGHPAGLRIGGDGGDIEDHRRIDDRHGDAMVDRHRSRACGEARHTRLSPQDGRASLWGRRRDRAERKERR